MSDIPIGNTKNWTLTFPSGKSTTLRRIRGIDIGEKYCLTQWLVDNGNKSRKIYPKSFLALSVIGISCLYYIKSCKAFINKCELSQNHRKELKVQYDLGRKQGKLDITHDKITPEQLRKYVNIIANVEDLKRAKENEKALSDKKSEFITFLKEIDQ